MNAMRAIILSITVMLVAFPAFAQDDVNALEQVPPTDSSAYKNTYTAPIERKLKIGMDLSMGYMYSPAGYSGPELFFGPRLTYPLSGRFWVDAGLQAGFGNYMMPVASYEGINYQMLPMTRIFLYASGNYKLSENLVVSGSVYRQVLNESYSESQAAITNYINNGMSVGFTYKIGSNISVGAQIQLQSNNHNPYSAGGFAPAGGYYNPYGW
jgi:hypothetical protein